MHVMLMNARIFNLIYMGVEFKLQGSLKVDIQLNVKYKIRTFFIFIKMKYDQHVAGVIAIIWSLIKMLFNETKYRMIIVGSKNSTFRVMVSLLLSLTASHNHDLYPGQST